MAPSPDEPELPTVTLIGQFSITVQCLPLGEGPGKCLSQPHEALTRVERAIRRVLDELRSPNHSAAVVVHDAWKVPL